MSILFKKCSICGNEVLVMKDSGNNIVCCGKQMEIMSPKTPKEHDEHMPYVYQADDKVLITIKHSNSEEHHIEWIILETSKGFYKTVLEKDEIPSAIYNLQKDEFVVNIYFYCNMHGLFKEWR